MSDFNDAPFVAGSVIGVRSFDVDILGRLRGVTHDDVFLPGENVGTCKGPSSAGVQAQLARLQRALNSAPRATPARSVTHYVPEKTHRVAQHDCTCGYYAYTNVDSTTYVDGRARALVEGYGTVTVGQLGFRAQKARLIALVDATSPRPRRATDHRHWDRWSDLIHKNAPAYVASIFVGVMGCGTSFVASVGTVANHGSPWWLALLLVTLTCVGLIAATAKGASHGLDRAYPDLPPYCQCVAHKRDRATGAVDYATMQLVRRNYPEVPVYATLADALAAHPLTTIPDPSPADEDFWTREAR